MPAPQIFETTAFEDGSVWLSNRVFGEDGADITQASLTAITCKVFDGDTVITTPTVTVSSAVHDTLQTNSDDKRWTLNNVGFNFEHVGGAADLPNGGKVYVFEFLFNPVTGEDFRAVWHVTTINLRTS